MRPRLRTSLAIHKRVGRIVAPFFSDDIERTLQRSVRIGNFFVRLDETLEHIGFGFAQRLLSFQQISQRLQTALARAIVARVRRFGL